jgi:hypothetical protein
MIITFNRGGNEMAVAYIIRNFPDDLHHRAKIRAVEERISLRELILKALGFYLDQTETGTKR